MWRVSRVEGVDMDVRCETDRVGSKGGVEDEGTCRRVECREGKEERRERRRKGTMS